MQYAAKSEACKPADPAHAMNMALLALAQQQRKHPEEARRALDEASQVINRLQADARRRDHDLQIAQILFREADALLNAPTKP